MRLEQLSRAHRLCETENTIGMLVLFQPVKPLMDIVRFQQTVGSQVATTGPMRPSIGHQDTETVSQEQFRVANHSQPVVT